MESTHLLYFKEIAEAESLTQAARALHISQPALSKSLANLEKELGRSLFNRVGGRLYLNSDGKALLEYANQIGAIMEQIQARFAQKEEAGESLSLYSIGNYFSFIMKNYFQYATGYSAAIALSRKILAEGKPAVERYLGFLSGGCSKTPIDLLKGAGVDMTSPEPVNTALELFGKLLDEMEELMQ